MRDVRSVAIAILIVLLLVTMGRTRSGASEIDSLTAEVDSLQDEVQRLTNELEEAESSLAEARASADEAETALNSADDEADSAERMLGLLDYERCGTDILTVQGMLRDTQSSIEEAQNHLRR